jgi:hypothetical protein
VDAIGGARFDDGAGGDNEVQRTMLEILTQLDGFDSRGNIKVEAVRCWGLFSVFMVLDLVLKSVRFGLNCNFLVDCVCFKKILLLGDYVLLLITLLLLLSSFSGADGDESPGHAGPGTH